MPERCGHIDPLTVARWFADHPAVMPCRGAFVRRPSVACGGLPSACCGLTTLLLVADAPPFDLSRLRPDLGGAGVGEIARALGLSGDYALGYVAGWDGRRVGWWRLVVRLMRGRDEGAWEAGYVDGVRAWESTVKPI